MVYLERGTPAGRMSDMSLNNVDSVCVLIDTRRMPAAIGSWARSPGATPALRRSADPANSMRSVEVNTVFLDRGEVIRGHAFHGTFPSP